MSRDAVIIAFPGMGATAVMHARLGALMPGLEAVDWPSHAGCAGFTDLAAKCIDAYGITRRHVLAGSSMGGMVACEIARILRNEHLVLIGSCHDPAAIVLRPLAGLASHMATDGMLELVGSKGHLSAVSRMLRQVDPAFIRWSLAALTAWRGVPAGDLRNIHRIHGMLDPVIPITRIAADKTIYNGGHLIGMTHPRIVARFITLALSEPDRMSS